MVELKIYDDTLELYIYHMANPPPHTSIFLLLETGDHLLLETSDKIIIGDFMTPINFLLETGDHLLLETSDHLLM
jgi:hypothetical protein